MTGEHSEPSQPLPIQFKGFYTLRGDGDWELLCIISDENEYGEKLEKLLIETLRKNGIGYTGVREDRPEKFVDILEGR